MRRFRRRLLDWVSTKTIFNGEKQMQRALYLPTFLSLKVGSTALRIITLNRTQKVTMKLTRYRLINLFVIDVIVT